MRTDILNQFYTKHRIDKKDNSGVGSELRPPPSHGTCLFERTTMRNFFFGRAFLLGLVLAFSSGCGNVAANLARQPDPAQALQQTQPWQMAQVFTLTTSSPATYSNPSG